MRPAVLEDYSVEGRRAQDPELDGIIIRHNFRQSQLADATGAVIAVYSNFRSVTMAVGGEDRLPRQWLMYSNFNIR